MALFGTANLQKQADVVPNSRLLPQLISSAVFQNEPKITLFFQQFSYKLLF
jgi:hypothetical protein